MRTAQDIYEAYRVMPSLQLHQLRVAAVGQMVCEALTQEVNVGEVTLACLFHDMGNIIKSDLSRYPEFLEPEGLAHWEAVKADYIARYGADTHAANVAIAKEIGLPEHVVRIIDSIGFSNIQAIAAGTWLELKIVEYGDIRVGPHGVVSLEARFADALERYAHRYESRGAAETAYVLYAEYSKRIEKDLLESTHLLPSDITEKEASLRFGALRAYEIP